jgi:hypothetical protein
MARSPRDGRKVRIIVRRQKMAEKVTPPSVTYLQAVIAASYGNGSDTEQRTVYCGWCNIPKAHTKDRCAYCNKYFSTTIPQKSKSQVYIEEID